LHLSRDNLQKFLLHLNKNVLRILLGFVAWRIMIVCLIFMSRHVWLNAWKYHVAVFTLLATAPKTTNQFWSNKG
jgi:hypothetical protein